MENGWLIEEISQKHQLIIFFGICIANDSNELVNQSAKDGAITKSSTLPTDGNLLPFCMT